MHYTLHIRRKPRIIFFLHPSPWLCLIRWLWSQCCIDIALCLGFVRTHKSHSRRNLNQTDNCLIVVRPVPPKSITQNVGDSAHDPAACLTTFYQAEQQSMEMISRYIRCNSDEDRKITWQPVFNYKLSISLRRVFQWLHLPRSFFLYHLGWHRRFWAA